MNKRYLSLSAVALALGLFIRPLTSQAQVNLKSISVGASYWAPSLDYWNNSSFLTDYNAGKGAKLSGKIMPTAALEIGIAKGLSIGGRVGYWKNSASSSLSIGGIKRNETFSLSIIPVALDLKYTIGESASSDAKAPFVMPYVGVSVARYFINNKLDRQVVDNTGSVNETQAGNTYGVQVFVGAEKQLVKKLYLGLDVRYHLGSYNQVVAGESTSTTQKVSLNGLEAGLSLRVKFK
jgi:outer membrane protein W